MNRTFQTAYTALTTAMLAALIFLSCENPVLPTGTVTNMGSSGAMEIVLSVSQGDRSVTPEDYGRRISGYEVLLSGTQALGPISVTEPFLLLEDLPLGEYTVSAASIDSDGRTLAAGSVSSVTVSGEQTGRADVVLLAVMGGEGTVLVSWDWSGAGLPDGYVDRVFAGITPTGGTPAAVNVTVNPDGLEYTGSFPSGEYVLVCELYADGEVVSTLSQTLQVFDGLETRTEESLDASDFQTTPPAPDLPGFGQTGLAVTLSWTDTSDLETGYAVYRSDDGGLVFDTVGINIPANTTGWTDEPVEPGTDYIYRIVAQNAFGDSEPLELPVRVEPAVTSLPDLEIPTREILIGDSRNTLPVDVLLDGFVNTFNHAALEISAVSIGDDLSAAISGGIVIIDASVPPFEWEGREVILRYTVHISGQPLNSSYSADGTAVLKLVAPEVEPIAEEELLEPVEAFIYDNRTDLDRKMRLYDPPDAREVFENWSRVSNSDFFEDEETARDTGASRGSTADLALQWNLKESGGDTYIEYTRNSVYAALVTPGGSEDDSYTLEATVTSGDDDDDTAGLVVAFVREADENYVLEAARSRGSVSGATFIEPQSGWGLVLRRLHTGAEQPEIGEVIWSRQLNIDGDVEGGWKGASSRIRVIRDGDIVTVSASAWNETDRYLPESQIRIDLGSDRRLARFSGRRAWGYFTASQERTSFRDIELSGGMVADKLFYIDPDTGASEVWWFDAFSKRWIRMAGADIQDVLGYPLEVTNPETGRTYLIERRGFRRGRWQDWFGRWKSWRERSRPGG